MPLDPVFVYGNYAEAGVWVAMGVFALIKRPSTAAAGLGVTLIAFGASDIVEAGTGAWYSPAWLLAWKAVCVVAIAAFGTAAWRQRRQIAERPPVPSPGTPGEG